MTHEERQEARKYLSKWNDPRLAKAIDHIARLEILLDDIYGHPFTQCREYQQRIQAALNPSKKPTTERSLP